MGSCGETCVLLTWNKTFAPTSNNNSGINDFIILFMFAHGSRQFGGVATTSSHVPCLNAKPRVSMSSAVIY